MEKQWYKGDGLIGRTDESIGGTDWKPIVGWPYADIDDKGFEYTGEFV